MSYDSNPPSCCIACAQDCKVAHCQQPLEYERNSNVVAPISIEGPTQQSQEKRVTFGANKPCNSHVEYLSAPILLEEKSQSIFSSTDSQSQETQASPLSPDVNKSRRDRPERPHVSIPEGQGQGRRSASDYSSLETPRPHLLRGTATERDTQYVRMLLAIDAIPIVYTLLALFFNWILLAGFIIIPGTLTSLENLQIDTSGSGWIEQELVDAITEIPL